MIFELMGGYPEFCSKMMANVFGVSRSGYYHYVKAGTSLRLQQDSQLLDEKPTNSKNSASISGYIYNLI